MTIVSASQGRVVGPCRRAMSYGAWGTMQSPAHNGCQMVNGRLWQVLLCVLKSGTGTRGVIASVLFAALCIGGCSGDYARSLPNGYRLVRTNSATIAIWGPRESLHSGVIVPAKITSVGISGAFVFGETEYSAESELSDISVAGYFILDTASGDAEVGVEMDAFVARCTMLGICADGVMPEMTSPRSVGL